MNHDDLHGAFDDLARRGADDQADRLRRGDGISADRVTSVARSHRRRRAAVASVAGFVLLSGAAVAGATVLDRPAPPQPAAPSPTQSSTPFPSTTGLAPQPAPTTTAPTAGTTTSWSSGLLDPYPTAPQIAWTTSGASLWTPGPLDAGQTPTLGDVTASVHSLPSFRGLSAGGTWLVAAGTTVAERLVGVDASTGVVRWTLDDVIMCGGVHDDLFVCLGVTDGLAAVQLRDPVTGEVVRTVGGGGDGIAVADGLVLVHGVVDDTDVHVVVRDLDTGETRFERTLPDAVDPGIPESDGVVQWKDAGSVVRVQGVQYTFALDVRSGTLLGESVDRPFDVRADGWVTGYAADGTMHAVGPAGQDVVLPGQGTQTPRVWVPADDLDLPLFSEPDVGGDVVHALDPVSGEQVWSFGGVSHVTAVAGRTAVLLGSSELVGVDVLTGSELWRTPLGDVLGFDGARLVIDDRDGLVAVDLRDGTVAWSVSLDPALAVETVAGRLAVTGPDGSLGALVP